MNMPRALVAAAITCVLATTVVAEDKKDNAKLIVGVWEVTKADADTVPKGTLVEFTKAGKLKIKLKIDEKEMVLDGTYKVDGDKFIMTISVEGNEMKQTITIKKLTDKEFATTNEEGKSVELKRMK